MVRRAIILNDSIKCIRGITYVDGIISRYVVIPTFKNRGIRGRRQRYDSRKITLTYQSFIHNKAKFDINRRLLCSIRHI